MGFLVLREDEIGKQTSMTVKPEGKQSPPPVDGHNTGSAVGCVVFMELREDEIGEQTSMTVT